MKNIKIPFDYWFEPTRLAWGHQFIPCLQMVSCEIDNKDETHAIDIFINNIEIFDTEEGAMDFAKNDSSAINHCLGLNEESLITCTKLSKDYNYFPRLLFVDKKLTPKTVTKDRALFIRFLQEKSMGDTFYARSGGEGKHI